MVALQFGFAEQFGAEIPAHILMITFAGTMSVYSLDRFLESQAGFQLHARHEIHNVGLVLILGCTSLSAIFFMWHATPDQWMWLAVLGISGAVYLLVTSGLLKTRLAVKEVLGSIIFFVLVLGLVRPDWVTGGAFILLGLSNFIWSSYHDRERDQVNDVPSLAMKYPVFAPRLARTLALGASIGFGPSTMGLISLIHALWPQDKPRIDYAFLPVILWVLHILFL